MLVFGSDDWLVCVFSVLNVLTIKRKRVVLLLADEIKIIKQLDKLKAGKHLAEKFAVGTMTIYFTAM